MSKEPVVIRAVVEFEVHHDEGTTATEVASELVGNYVEIASNYDVHRKRALHREDDDPAVILGMHGVIKSAKPAENRDGEGA